MKYIIFSFTGEGLPIAWQLQNEGQEVIVGYVEDINDTITRIESPTEEYSRTKTARLRLFNGILNKMPIDQLIEQMKTIPDPENYFVFCEMNTLFKFADQVRHLGFHGYFPYEDDYIYEIDRKAAKDLVEKYYPELRLPETKTFTTIQEAKEFLATDNSDWLIKGFDPSSHVFIPDAHDPQLAHKQIIAELESYKPSYEKSGFLLEHYIRNLIEYLPQRIYYDGELMAVTVDIENKPIGSGNVSYQTGCAADLVFPVSFDSAINRIAFPTYVDELAKQHKGLFFWDASLLIDKDTDIIYFGEFCANRPGYNEFFTQLAQLPSVHYFFESIVQHKQPFTFGSMAASTRIFNMNRDDNDVHLLNNLPLEFLTNDTKHFWPFDMYQNNDRLVVSGCDFNLGVVTGTGENIWESCKAMAENISLLSYGDKYYRPLTDFLSRGYTSSILNRLDYGLKHNLFSLPEKTLGTILEDIPENIL